MVKVLVLAFLILMSMKYIAKIDYMISLNKVLTLSAKNFC